jgi:hypothetical protein
MQRKSLWSGAAFMAAAFLGGMAGSWIVSPGSPEAGVVVAGGGSNLVATYGVGGVVTRSGKIWQYRPDKSKWITLDESFALEGQGTSAFPLPVPVENIRFMETFGFLVARGDECWLYDFEQNRWNSIGSPPS